MTKSIKEKLKKNKFLTWVLIFSCTGLLAVISVTAAFFFLQPSPEPAAPAIVPVATPRPAPAPAPTPAHAPEPTPDPMLGMVHSPLTGLPIPEESAPLRPVAVVINNHTRALPQSGISQAEIIYEVLAEGNITRLVAIFHQLEVERIGPVRSTRDYFADFAIAYDAVFAHHGGSPSGYARLRNLGIPFLDGMALESTTFWRDPERRRIPALIEHSSFTGATILNEAMERRNIRRERYEDDGIGFEFNMEEIPFQTLARATGGTFRPCLELIVPFSDAYARRFVFDPETYKFAVYNRNGPHIDENILLASAAIEDDNDNGNDEDADENDTPVDAQVRVKNVLVQHVRMRTIPGDAEGRREVHTVGSGSGYLATMGGIIPVLWERDSVEVPTRWYFMNGNPLQLTPGNTWINVLQDTVAVEIVTRIDHVEEDNDTEEENDNE